MIPLDEARAWVLERCPVGPVEEVPLAQARGRVTAAAVRAEGPVPPFANTAMDGFAVRAADTAGAPVTLRLIGTVRAGESGLAHPVDPGEAVRIMTGAPIPPGADSIVMVERTSVPTGVDDEIRIEVEVEPGLHIRPAGDDIAAGEVVLGPGVELSPGHLGVLATAGARTVEVIRPPRVGVMSTGDELVDDGSALGPGQIRDSNRLTLCALLEESGFDVVDLGLVRDDETAIESTLLDGVDRCDALVTSGGVSMGDFDLVKVVLDRIGEMRWMQVAIKPAKPLAFGTITRPSDSTAVPVFGLPGNPVSSMVSFELFCRPALRRMAGVAEDRWSRPLLTARAEEPLVRRPDGKTHFARVRVRHDPESGSWLVRSAGNQGSHQMMAMASADALAVLPDGPTIEIGDVVSIMVLRN